MNNYSSVSASCLARALQRESVELELHPSVEALQTRFIINSPAILHYIWAPLITA
jgi:hypothetical protein